MDRLALRYSCGRRLVAQLIDRSHAIVIALIARLPHRAGWPRHVHRASTIRLTEVARLRGTLFTASIVVGWRCYVTFASWWTRDWCAVLRSSRAWRVHRRFRPMRRVHILVSTTIVICRRTGDIHRSRRTREIAAICRLPLAIRDRPGARGTKPFAAHPICARVQCCVWRSGNSSWTLWPRDRVITFRHTAGNRTRPWRLRSWRSGNVAHRRISAEIPTVSRALRFMLGHSAGFVAPWFGAVAVAWNLTSASGDWSVHIRHHRTGKRPLRRHSSWSTCIRPQHSGACRCKTNLPIMWRSGKVALRYTKHVTGNRTCIQHRMFRNRSGSAHVREVVR